MVDRRHLFTLIRVIAILATMAGAALTGRSGVTDTDPSLLPAVVSADKLPGSSFTDCDHDNDLSKDNDNDQNAMGPGCT
jgi:hypothetical protein